ncbi:MAG: HRDC domain-containing protein [Sedimentisphaerales bacterium]|nr:HRDC domain-containing protein [Sedimentisphaerales bacterium]
MELNQPVANYIYVDTNEKADELCLNMENAKSVAIDTECDSLYHYFEKVCLLQLSFNGQNYLVDTLSKIKLTAILEVLSYRRIIVHCGDYDFRMLRKCYGFKPRGEVFDTWIAARLLGMPKVSLTDLASELIGIDMPKGSQKSDWSARPLSTKQVEYAVKDTSYLEQMADILEEGLKAKGRSNWLSECVVEMLERSCLNEDDSVPDPAKQWRIKGLRTLSQRQLEYVRQIWYWRDSLARKSDRPPFKVMSNETIVSLAIWASFNPGKPIGEAKKVRLPGNLVGKKYNDLLDALDAAANTPEKDLPPVRLPCDNNDYDEDFTYVNLEPYQRAAQQVASRLNIESPILITRSQWYLIINSNKDQLEQVFRENGILPWKYQYIKEMLDIVNGN